MSIWPVVSAFLQCLHKALFMSTWSSCLLCFVEWLVVWRYSFFLKNVFASTNCFCTVQCLSHNVYSESLALVTLFVHAVLLIVQSYSSVESLPERRFVFCLSESVGGCFSVAYTCCTCSSAYSVCVRSGLRFFAL